jgi:tRNA U34 5-methylaminomethyl-2-thiouridine-forming methyltransferase MnmC
MNNSYPATTPHQEVLKIMTSCFQKEKEGNRSARSRAAAELENFLKITEDGTFTISSQIVDGQSENMHSYHGALQESLEKFVIPAGVDGFNEIKFLDLCSGLGYNATAAINYWAREEVVIKIDMVEYSPEILGASLLIPPLSNAHLIVRRALEKHLIQEGHFSQEMEENIMDPHVQINVYIEDVRKVLDRLEGDYNAVFLDPFSTAKSPELYSLEFFQKIYPLIKEGGRILTYTNAAPVRSALLKAGFEIGIGPLSGGRTGTIAIKGHDPSLKDLSSDEERMIALSDAGICFHDPYLDLDPSIITQNRNEERARVRGSEKFASTVRTPQYLYNNIENPKTQRRIQRQMKKLGINDPNSLEARYLICPQYEECICFCGLGRFKSSKDRIEEMERRLEEYLKKNNPT